MDEKKVLTREEFLALPIKERRKLMKESLTPELVDYYNKLAIGYDFDGATDGHSTMM